MPLTDEQKKEYQREYMKKRRSNKKDVRPDEKPVRPEKNVRPDVLDPVRPTENVLDPVRPDVRPIDDYPPIVHYLADDVKRENLRRISDSLSNHNVSELVRFGVFGITFDKIGEILTAFPVNKRVYDSCYGV